HAPAPRTAPRLRGTACGAVPRPRPPLRHVVDARRVRTDVTTHDAGAVRPHSRSRRPMGPTRRGVPTRIHLARNTRTGFRVSAPARVNGRSRLPSRRIARSDHGSGNPYRLPGDNG